MKFDPFVKIVFGVYLMTLVVVTLIPLGGMSTSMSDTDIAGLRLDYLVHALVFIPFVPLWKLVRSRTSLWLILVAGILVAAAAEGSHYILPYRGYNILDLLANVSGVIIGGIGYQVTTGFRKRFRPGRDSRCRSVPLRMRSLRPGRNQKTP